MNLSDGKFQNDVDGLVLGVLFLNSFEHALSLLTIGSLSVLSASATASPFAGLFAVLFDNPQAYNLISVVDELIDEPLQRSIGIVVGICATEKGSRALGVLILAVFATEG